MAILQKPSTFSTGAVILASEHNSNFDTLYNDYNGNISNVNISATAAIADTKLAQVTTASKVSGTSLTGLASIPAGAGIIPEANTGLPSGIICMWSGTIATIPTGWVLCDGNNSTPDLTNQFIVGADADDGGVAKTTITGSALQSHATGLIPNHTHTYDKFSSVVDASEDTSKGADNDGKYTSTASGNQNITGHATKNIAVFFALAYIMRS